MCHDVHCTGTSARPKKGSAAVGGKIAFRFVNEHRGPSLKSDNAKSKPVVARGGRLRWRKSRRALQARIARRVVKTGLQILEKCARGFFGQPCRRMILG